MISARGCADVLQMLPLHIWHGTEMVDNRRAHAPQGSQDFFGHCQIAGPTECSDCDGAPVPGGIEKWQGWRVHECDQPTEGVRCLCGEVTKCPQYELRLLCRPHDHARIYLTYGMQCKLEAGDDAQAAAAAPQSPEQVRMFFRARPNEPAISENDRGCPQVVDGQSEPAHQPASTATEGESADSGARDEPAGRCEPAARRRDIDIVPKRTSL